MWESIASDSCVCQCPPRSRRHNLPADKENMQSLSPVKHEDISLYGNTTPLGTACSGTSPNHCNHNIITRRPLEDHDPNSRDSGYHTTYNGDGGTFTYTSPSRNSFESVGSMEDDFFEDFAEIEPLENLPQNFSKLITGPISVQNNKPAVQNISTASRDHLMIRPFIRRSLSFNDEATTVREMRSYLAPIVSRPFKRPEPPQEIENPTNSKKPKAFDQGEIRSVPVSRPILQRPLSVTEESIKFAVQRSFLEPDLIGDFSKSFCLPLTRGRHQDLKSITPATLAKLISGDFNSSVASFKVIDCRYPYEYNGGHIEGALNIYTKDQCMQLLNTVGDEKNQDEKRRNILVFHCEFSSERGPTLYRYLRERDRQLNQDVYPFLHFPEVYLLEGGYKNFYEQFSSLCVPIAYTEMLHPEHENEFRFFRHQSKSDSRTRGVSNKLRL